MRTKSIKSLYEQEFKTHKFTGKWSEIFGEPETGGAWLIWGAEKNGKTWHALMLADYVSKFANTLYISAEEGCGKNFVASCKRAGLDAQNKRIKAIGYVPIEEIEMRLEKRKAPKIIIIDNLTIYNDELKYGKFRQLLERYPDTLFIFLAHEENKQPFTSSAKLCQKLAKIIIHVQGLAAHVYGRCPGGVINIHEEKAQLYWGTENTKKEN